LRLKRPFDGPFSVFTPQRRKFLTIKRRFDHFEGGLWLKKLFLSRMSPQKRGVPL